MHKDSRIKIIEAEASSMQGTKGEVLTNDLAVIKTHKNKSSSKGGKNSKYKVF